MDAGVIDERRDGAPVSGLEIFLKCVLNFFGRAGIELHDLGGAVVLPDLRMCLFRSRRVLVVMDENVKSVPRKAYGDGSSDSG